MDIPRKVISKLTKVSRKMKTNNLSKIKELSFWALQKAESNAYSEDAWNTLDAYADTLEDIFSDPDFENLVAGL